MFVVPLPFAVLRDQLMSGFTRPATARRVLFLMMAAILVSGNRTVSNLLRLISLLDRVNPSTFHRVLSHRRWDATRVVKPLIALVLKLYAPEIVVKLVGDETTETHRGKKVYAKARHRDPVRSSHSHTVHLYGHKWVVLALLVKLPFLSRPLALPLLVALYRDKATNTREGRRHKTPVQLMCGLLALLMRWFPEKKWRFAGDGGYGTHEFARFAYRHRRRLSLVSKFYADANLHELPRKSKKGRNGRPPKKGPALPKPMDVVKQGKGKRMRVPWYGGGTRLVEAVTGRGNWFKSGHGLVPVRWVHVRDLEGTHREEYFFTTDLSLSAKEIIEMYGGRWNIETTFQEVRSYLGFATTRGWSRQTVLRAAPCLIMLYTIVVLMYDLLPRGHKDRPLICWKGKEDVAFSDMITHVRRYLWMEWVFAQAPGGEGIRKLSRPARRIIEYGLCQAA